MIRLGVNIDHVATIRNARGGDFPDPLRAALEAVKGGADGITAHLREDRRHIRDEDIARLMTRLSVPLNLEMAATPEMQAIALRHKPHAVCLVPERREERTTEGGLDAIGQQQALREFVKPLLDAGIRVSLFIAPDTDVVAAAKAIGAPVVELHTGAYAEAAIHLSPPERPAGSSGTSEGPGPTQLISPAPDPLPLAEGELCGVEIKRLELAAAFAAGLGIECHAGHGLTYDNVRPIAAIRQIMELNIGHFLVGEAVFRGLKLSVHHMRIIMTKARRQII